MTNNKRTIVTIERRERTVVRRGRGPAVAWCDRCGAEVRVVTLAEADARAQAASARDLTRLDEPCELHLPEADDGALPVCHNLPPTRSHDS